MAAAAVVVKKPLAGAPAPPSRRERRRPRCRCCQPAVSACRRFWDELLDAVRRRRSGQQRDQQETSEDTDEDLGLPRSPTNSPPTTADVLLDKTLKENPTKSHSTCSDGSLLSMGSSEMDEDSMGQNSGHSSKISLQDKKIYQENASDAELDIGVLAVPLSHSAARHKMAVRPKRTHGAPRRHRMQQISAGSSLPTTPEVNEEASCRSTSPEVKQRKENASEFSKNDDTEIPAWPSTATEHMLPPLVNLPIEIQQKSASLPPGLALTPGEHVNKLPRSRSNAAYRQTEASSSSRYKRAASASELEMNMSSIIALEALTKSREMFGIVGEEDEDEKADTAEDKDENKEKDEKKEETTFFGRLLSRRSGKKKKEKSDDVDSNLGDNLNKQISAPPLIPKRINEGGQYANDFFTDFTSHASSRHHNTKLQPRSSAASRQRVEPINLPPSPEIEKRGKVLEVPEVTSIPPNDYGSDILVTDKNDNVSVAEKVVPDVMHGNLSVSPPKHVWTSHSAGGSKEVNSTSLQHINADKRSESQDSLSNENEYKSSFRIGEALTREQPLPSAYDETDERECSSLVNTVEKPSSPKFPIKKSQSFRTDIDFSQKTHKKPASNTSNTLSNMVKESQDLSFQEDVREVEETTISYKSTISATISADETKIMTISSERPLSTKPMEKELLFYDETAANEKTNLFANNVYVSTTSVLKEKTIENIFTSVSSPEVPLAKENVGSLEKAASSESISTDHYSKTSSVLESKPPKTSSGSENDTNYTQHVVLPPGTDGITITQTFTKHEETKTDLKGNSSHFMQQDNMDIYKGENTMEEVVKADLSVDTRPSIAAINDATQQPNELVITAQESTKTESNLPEMLSGQESTAKSFDNARKSADLPKTPPGLSQQEKDSLAHNFTPRPQPTKREPRLATASEHVPEFLRIQLNRVDSQPAVNVIFDTDKPDPQRSRLKSIDEKLGIKTEQTDDADEQAKRASLISETSQETHGTTSSIKQKLFREEQFKAVKDGADGRNVTGKPAGHTSDGIQKICEPASAFEEIAKPEAGINNPVKTKRSISLTATPSQQNRNYSVVSISSEMQTARHPSKFAFKKQSSSFDSPDSHVPLNDNILNESEDMKTINKYEGSISTKDFGIQDVVIRKKSVQRDPILRKEEDCFPPVERFSSGRESVCSEASSTDNSHRSSKSKETFGSESGSVFENSMNEVVLRKKSVTKEIGLKNEEEPELLKVFARRSLKLKDSDIEVLSQQSLSSKNRENQAVSDTQATKSRDSDKENECGDSPKEERKKLPVKEPLVESKHHTDIVPEPPIKLAAPVNNTRHSSPANFKYQRSISGSSTASNENTNINENILSPYKKDNMSPEKRIRNKTVPESQRTDSCFISSERTPHRAWANIYKEKELHIVSTESKTAAERLNTQTENETNASEVEESSIPRFKRIQQRREEWEQRAQLASKRNLP
ncbi:uncharacterized protein LOC126281243 isoform X4 [Schistocerca gregaria]|uniref:uncharacterized protein LOC126281243 isoform X4 n=1 Tax=Schistocerca gregaria TaxID=7010 RepID=UPI00211EE0F5|nr:uncharacterized protein LOC126281243 isoform X4 [Schistocerca gregaria]